MFQARKVTIPKRRRVPIVLASLFAAGFAASVFAQALHVVSVSQKNRKFLPDRLEIAAGTTVRIMNDDNVTHHIYVQQSNMSFDSGEQPIGKSIDLKFDQPGRYDVRCAIHPTMLLRITVK